MMQSALTAIPHALVADVPLSDDAPYACNVTTTCRTSGCFDLGQDTGTTLSKGGAVLKLSDAFGPSDCARTAAETDEGVVRLGGINTVKSTFINWPISTDPDTTFSVHIQEVNAVCAGPLHGFDVATTTKRATNETSLACRQTGRSPLC